MSDFRLLMGEPAKIFRTLRSSVDLFFGTLGKVMIFLCGQRENPTGKARVQVKINGAETSKRLRSDLPLI